MAVIGLLCKVIQFYWDEAAEAAREAASGSRTFMFVGILLAVERDTERKVVRTNRTKEMYAYGVNGHTVTM